MNEKRQAGVDEEIEITPEMASAGADLIEAHTRYAGAMARDVACEVFRAMSGKIPKSRG
jgi:hypothetical protein